MCRITIALMCVIMSMLQHFLFANGSEWESNVVTQTQSNKVSTNSPTPTLNATDFLYKWENHSNKKLNSVEPRRSIRKRKHKQWTTSSDLPENIPAKSSYKPHHQKMKTNQFSQQATDANPFAVKLKHLQCCNCKIKDIWLDRSDDQAFSNTANNKKDSSTTPLCEKRANDPAKCSINSKKGKYYIAIFLPFLSEGQEDLRSTNTSTTSSHLLSIWNGIIMALRDINNSSKILPNSELCLDLVDTPCRPANGIQSYFEQIRRRPETLAVIGPLCYDVARTLAEAVQWWDLAQLSFNLDNIELSNHNIYPTFIRTIPDMYSQLLAIASFIRYNNWKVVDVVYSCSENYNNFLSIIEQNEIDIGIGFIFRLDSDLSELNNSRNNIKVFLGTSQEACQLFCKIYTFYRSLSTSSKVWIFSGKFSDDWWKIDGSFNCTASQLYNVTSSHILVDVQTSEFPGKQKKGFEQLSFENSRKSRRGSSKNSIKYFAYDTLLAASMALKTTLEKNTTFHCPSAINQTDDAIRFRRRFLCAFDEIYFDGQTGAVSFNRGERNGTVYCRQFVNGSYIPVGRHRTGNIYTSDARPLWPGGKGPPLATIETIFEMNYLSPFTFCFVATVSAIWILVAIFFLAFNIKHRKNKVIKISSPNLNNVIAVGCILAYIALLLPGLESRYVSIPVYDALCRLRQWVPTCAFTLAFGTMFLKTWRVYEIFTNVSGKRKIIKDYKLFAMLGVFVLIDISILVTWSVVDPMMRHVENSSTEIWQDNGSYVIYQIEYCKSKHEIIWMGAICAYKGILLVFGLFLAWETRQVAFCVLNESKHIGLSVYVTVITCVIAPTASFALKAYLDLSFASTSLAILLCISAILCLVFIPKLAALRRMQKHPEEFRNLRLQGLGRKKNIAVEPVQNILSMTIRRGSECVPNGTNEGNGSRLLSLQIQELEKLLETKKELYAKMSKKLQPHKIPRRRFSEIFSTVT